MKTLPSFFLLLLLACTAAAPPVNTNTVTYDAGFARFLSAPRTVEMSGGVTFTQSDARLQTRAAVVTLDDQQRAVSAKSASPVHLNDAQNDLTGASGFVDFTRHLATVTGSVTLLMRPGAQETNAPKGSPRKNFKAPATMTCALMTYDYRKKTGIVPGPLTVHQSIVRVNNPVPLQRTLTADGATYDGNAQTVTLTGTVRGTDSDGNAIEAKAVPGRGVVIGIKEGAETIEASFPVHGVFQAKDNDAPPAPAPPVKPAPKPR